MKRRTALAFVALCCGTSLLHAQEATSKSTSNGVFTAEQAKRGASAYNSNCATCHGSELRSADREVPSLTDRSFKFSWVGKTIAEKFQIARDTMPPEEKHSLDDQVYLDIVSYILHFNKIPSGKEPLKADMQILQQIVIAAPPD